MDNKGIKLCGHVRVVELACSVSLSGPFPASVPQSARPLGGGRLEGGRSLERDPERGSAGGGSWGALGDATGSCLRLSAVGHGMAARLCK